MTDTTIPMITFDVALKGINNAIVDQGSDFVYGSGQCRYVAFDVDGYRSSCIVGHFLVNTLGIDPKVFEEEGINTGAGIGVAMHKLTELGLIVGITDKASLFLGKVQNEQDSRETWGRAVVSALDEVYHRFNKFDENETYM